MANKTIGDLTAASSVADADLIHVVQSGNSRQATIAQLFAGSAASALISDTAYGASWNGATTVAPSKNAVYDQMELKANLAGGNTFTGNQVVTGDITASNLVKVITASGKAILNGNAPAGGFYIANTADTIYLDVYNSGGIWYYDSDSPINFTQDLTVPDEAYGAGWNGDLSVPTKNAVYDKVESILDGQAFTGDLTTTGMMKAEDGFSSSGQLGTISGVNAVMYCAGGVTAVFAGYNGTTWEPAQIIGSTITMNISAAGGDEFSLTGSALTMAVEVIVPDEAYDATGWNGDLSVPTKNAVRDKLESAGWVTKANMADIGTDRLLGRDTAASGVPEELTVGGGIEFTGSGGIQTAAFTGDVTKSAGGTALTIAADAVTFAKIQNTSGASKLLGRGSASGAGDVEEITLGTNLSMSGTTLNATGGGGLSDADYGDITVSGGGTVMTIDPGVVTLAKMANVATDRLLGRDTAAAGVPEELTVGGGIEFTGTGGIQTSAFTGDVTKAAGGTALTIANDAVTYAKMQNVSATDKLLGRSTAGAGDVEEIACTAAGRALLDDASASDQRTTLGLAAIAASGSGADLGAGTVTLAKIANIATDRLLGRDTAASGVPEELTVGGGIEFTGSGGIQTSAFTGDVTKAAGGTALTLASNQKIRSISFIIDGGGSTITTGVKGFIEVPFACTITGWTALGDQSGSIVVDVWKDTYANYPPTVADTIAGTEKPTISTATKGQDTSLSTWTTSVSAGDILGFNVDSVTTLQRVTIALKVTVT